ncbi:hypothetical protein TNCV_5034321 [Trichonephila clavipes]|nr:hypothetical protein TNCV_5034321 [Trichonephila clavipes]
MNFPGEVTKNPKLSYEHPLSGFPSQSRRKPGFPVTVGGIPFPKTEYLKRKSLIQRRQNSYILLWMWCSWNHSIKMPHLQPNSTKDDALSSSLNQSNFYSFLVKWYWDRTHDMPAMVGYLTTYLIEEVFMRHGIPRRIISDNGTQFVSAVLQQICFTLNISQNFIPVYSPQSNQ